MEKLTSIYYCIGGLFVQLDAPASWEIDRLLPSFVPFRCQTDRDMDSIFRLLVTTQPLDCSAGWQLIDSSYTDLGKVHLYHGASGYRVELVPVYGEVVHTLSVNATFTQAHAVISVNDRYMGDALGSMLRILYSQAVLLHRGVLLHAAAVAYKGSAYLFLGKSGTGKSTHAAGWLRVLPDCLLLNDDNPVVVWEEGRAYAYGTPWSGKTPCYKNMRCELAGIVRLEQAPYNRFELCRDVSAFVQLLPSASAIQRDNILYGELCNTLTELVEFVPFGKLYCLPDDDAVRVCETGLCAANKIGC